MIAPQTDSTSLKAILRPDRGVIHLQGSDTLTFLHALTTQDVLNISAHHALYSFLLTPQGRYIADFFILKHPEGGVLLDAPLYHTPVLLKALRLYRLRYQVTITDLSDTARVFSVWPQKDWEALDTSCQKSVTNPPSEVHLKMNDEKQLRTYLNISDQKTGTTHTADRNASAGWNQEKTVVLFLDPRFYALGLRAVSLNGHIPWDQVPLTQRIQQTLKAHRIMCGIAEGKDFESQRSVLLEYGAHHLNGIALQKGCYVGQELISRTLHRGQINKHVFPAYVCGALPPVGTEVRESDGHTKARIISLCPWPGDAGEGDVLGAQIADTPPPPPHCLGIALLRLSVQKAHALSTQQKSLHVNWQQQKEPHASLACKAENTAPENTQPHPPLRKDADTKESLKRPHSTLNNTEGAEAVPPGFGSADISLSNAAEAFEQTSAVLYPWTPSWLTF